MTPDTIPRDTFDAVLEEAREANQRVREAAYHELLREPYRAEMAADILARVPPELEVLNEDVVLRAAARFGFEIEEQNTEKSWLIEHGAQSLVDHLPGVPEGSRYLGTFDRATGVDLETIDFFAAGHPLVEGILAELEDGRRGRAAVLQIPGDQEVFGLLAVYRRGSDFELIAVDGKGRTRPNLAEWLSENLDLRERVDARKWTSQPSWEQGIRRLAEGPPRRRTAACGRGISHPSNAVTSVTNRRGRARRAHIWRIDSG